MAKSRYVGGKHFHGEHLRSAPTDEQVAPLLAQWVTPETPRFELHRREKDGRAGKRVLALVTLPEILWALDLEARGRRCNEGDRMKYLCTRAADEPLPQGVLMDPETADPDSEC